MSVRMAIAKLTAAAAGGAVIGGGAVHVAEPQAAQVDYKTGENAEVAEVELIDVKDTPVAQRTIPPRPREQRRLRRTIETEAGVEGVHHLHVWQVDERRASVEAHLVLAEGADGVEAVRRVKARIAEAFGIHHATFETETRASGCSGTGCRIGQG